MSKMLNGSRPGSILLNDLILFFDVMSKAVKRRDIWAPFEGLPRSL